MQRFLANICGGGKYISDDVDVLLDGNDSLKDFGIKSIIVPNNFTQTRSSSSSTKDNDTVMEKRQVPCTNERAQRRSNEIRTGFMELFPCSYSTTKWKGLSVHGKEDKDVVIPRGEDDDDDSYSDESTRMYSFFSDHEDNYLHNLVADYLKNRLIHLHSRERSRVSVYEGGEEQYEFSYHSPSLKQKTIAMDEDSERLCHTSHSEEDEANSCPTSGGSSASFDSREKYSLNDQQQQQNNKYLSTVNVSVIEPSPCFTERYSFQEASISIEHPLTFYEEKMGDSLRIDEYNFHLNTISAFNDASLLSTSYCSNDRGKNSLDYEKYAFSTDTTEFNDVSIHDSDYSHSNIISIEPKLDVKPLTILQNAYHLINESNVKDSRYHIISSLDNSQRMDKDSCMKTNSQGYDDCLNVEKRVYSIKDEVIREGTGTILEELALIRSSLNKSELLGPFHRVKQISNASPHICLQ